jgi:hypothetical protein
MCMDIYNPILRSLILTVKGMHCIVVLSAEKLKEPNKNNLLNRISDSLI